MLRRGRVASSALLRTRNLAAYTPNAVQKLTTAVVPPLVAACLMLAAYAVAVNASGSSVFAIDTWFKWDGGHYFDIAHTGYALVDCAGVPGFHPGQWCGNAGWFPGYPYVVRGVHLLTGADTKLVAVLVSQTFAALSLILIWNVFLSRRNWALLLLCAFAPGTYYFLVIFPMSMTMCFILVALWAQRQGDSVLALLAGTVVGFTYPSGLWLAGVMASGLLFEQWRGKRPRPRAWLAAAGPVMGFGLVLLDHHVSVGAWNAFFLTQQKYQHGIHNPVAVLRERLASLGVWNPGWQTAVQSLTAATLVAVGAASAMRAVWRRKEQPADVALAVHGLTYWLLPLVLGGGLSPYRSESLLMPAVAGLQRIPRLAVVVLLLAAIAIWIVMATEFAKGSLV
jgi:hypothetical protein